MRVSDSEAVVTCRRISSKSYLEELGLTRAPCAWVPEFPRALLAGLLHGSTGERPAEVRPRPPPPRPPLTRITREQPQRSAFPRNPSPGAFREGPGLRIQTTGPLPPGGSQTPLRSKAAQER